MRYTLPEYYGALAEEGLVPEGYIEVTLQGRLFLRNIAMCFDAYLTAIPKEKPLFSRTV